MKDLAGKTAIVTGGASGIGLGIARALVGAGMNVAIGDIQEEALAAAADTLGYPEQVMTRPLDVTDREDYRAFVDAVEHRFGNVHLLVNNAGVVVSGPVAQASFSDWDWVLNVNLVGAANGLVIVLPRILAHGEGGHVVNTASTSGLLPHPGATIYVTTKSALIGMTEAMRCELEPQGVTCSVLCPGPVRSRITEADRNRPADYADSGYGLTAPEEGKEKSPGPGAAELLMAADEVGEIVRDGIQRDLLYIFTHNEHRRGLEERAAAIDAALPQRPKNTALEKLMTGTLINPAHSAEIARHRGD